jgi:hypothetical protein
VSGGGDGSTRFRGGRGVPVADDEGDEVLQHNRTTGNDGTLMAEAKMAGGGSSPKGAVGGGGVDVPPIASYGQKARGVRAKWFSWHARKGEGGGGRGGSGDGWRPFKLVRRSGDQH